MTTPTRLIAWAGPGWYAQRQGPTNDGEAVVLERIAGARVNGTRAAAMASAKGFYSPIYFEAAPVYLKLVQAEAEEQ